MARGSRRILCRGLERSRAFGLWRLCDLRTGGGLATLPLQRHCSVNLLYLGLSRNYPQPLRIPYTFRMGNWRWMQIGPAHVSWHIVLLRRGSFAAVDSHKYIYHKGVEYHLEKSVGGFWTLFCSHLRTGSVLNLLSQERGATVAAAVHQIRAHLSA